LFYSGLFALHTRSAVALRQVLTDYFEVPVEVEQFVGAWYPLSIPNQCQLDNSAVSEQLGIGAVVGDEIWDQGAGVRVRLGPLDLRQYLDFLPEGTAYAPLRAITRFFSGDEIDFEVQLILKRDDVPACELDDVVAVVPQLGWSTWVKSAPMTRDPADTILRI
jgi:type VI secretion system protein ImpH